MPTTPLGIPTPSDATKISAFPKAVRDGLNKVDEVIRAISEPRDNNGVIETLTDVHDMITEDWSGDWGVRDANLLNGPPHGTGLDLSWVLQVRYSYVYGIVIIATSGNKDIDGNAAVPGMWITNTIGVPVEFQPWRYIPTNEEVLSLDAVDPEALPVASNVPDMAFGWADEDGNLAAWIDMAGSMNLSRDPNSPGMTPITPSSGWSHAIADVDGNVAAGVDSRGRFQSLRGAGALTGLRDQLVCIGDSLTSNYTGNRWTQIIQDNHPEITVTNRGFSGHTTDEIRALLGIQPLYLTPAGGTIPASGPVTVTTKQVIGWSTGNTIKIPGTLAGVPGTFVRTSETLTFTRTIAGAPVSVTRPSLLRVAMEDYSAHTVVLWVGRNDVNQSITGLHDTVADHVVAGVMDTVEWLSPRVKNVLVISTTNQVAEEAGTPRYETIVAINERLAYLLPGKFLDLRKYLVHQAIYDIGLTPTPADLASMEADAPPQSIWDNGSHFLPIAIPFVAAQIQTRLEQKGLI